MKIDTLNKKLSKKFDNGSRTIKNLISLIRCNINEANVSVGFFLIGCYVTQFVYFQIFYYYLHCYFLIILLYYQSF